MDHLIALMHVEKFKIVIKQANKEFIWKIGNMKW